MLFSSISFLYYFFPLLLICYFATPKKYRNYTLLLASLIFYFYGEPKYLIILVGLCILNYFIAIQIETSSHKKQILIFALSFNFLYLIMFKYFDFIIENLNLLFQGDLSLLYLVMPIGISFFTFQSCSYLIDVYHQKSKATRKLSNYMLYIMMFPQLIAGPIVRYNDIAPQLEERSYNFNKFNQGMFRFVAGLAKKVIIADTFGFVCDTLLKTSSIGFVGSWMFAIAATLQIYFDFSGYSDMAIGLGKILGFQLPENFHYPLCAKHITDFWKRWHITLSSWFKDYVYIPLGGNRKGIKLQIRNILIVWTLTGLWHGAAWNYILWGFLFAIVLAIEKLGLKAFMEKHYLIGHTYTLLIVFISFTIFRIQDLNNLLFMLGNMFSFSNILTSEVWYYIQNYAGYFLIAALLSTPLLQKIFKQDTIGIWKCVGCIILLMICTGYLVDGNYHPFLYFRF